MDRRMRCERSITTHVFGMSLVTERFCGRDTSISHIDSNHHTRCGESSISCVAKQKRALCVERERVATTKQPRLDDLKPSCGPFYWWAYTPPPPRGSRVVDWLSCGGCGGWPCGGACCVRSWRTTHQPPEPPPEQNGCVIVVVVVIPWPLWDPFGWETRWMLLRRFLLVPRLAPRSTTTRDDNDYCGPPGHPVMGRNKPPIRRRTKGSWTRSNMRRMVLLLLVWMCPQIVVVNCF